MVTAMDVDAMKAAALAAREYADTADPWAHVEARKEYMKQWNPKAALALLRERDRLREALEVVMQYPGHASYCDGYMDGSRCDCGYTTDKDFFERVLADGPKEG